MAQSARGGAVRFYSVGDYQLGNQIGAGSFSTVWHAHHRVHGTEVAIKEIVTARLNSKLQESLKSEIFILKRINHPNIIHLHDMIEESGKMYIILEYCKGGDLSMFIQRRHGRIPEATAKHFMQQLAEGLKVLREFNLIHRDLKPQNLLLSTNEDNSVLKIADFGFARSLQPRGLAETLCGSPLYMAPEIMQLQKYDAKADLWSVGAILFQLATGKTPFTGSNQIQLLQNIIKSTELRFPPEARNLNPHCIDLCRKLLRRNPVERLTFEEFFNHPYLSRRETDQSIRNSQPLRVTAGFPLPEWNTEENTLEYCLPFSLDGDSSGPDQSPSFTRRSSVKPMHGFSLNLKADQREIANLRNRTDSLSKYTSVPQQTEILGSSPGSQRLSEGNLKESLDLGLLDNHPKVMDSLESIDWDYVFVSDPPMDLSFSGRASKPTRLPFKTECPSPESGNVTSSTSAPVPINATEIGRAGYIRNLDNRMSTAGTSQGSMDVADTSEQPSTHCTTRIKSLKRCASAISELVNEKIGEGKKLEAFSIQLVILAIWKQALDVCHTHAASAIEGSPSKETTKIKDISKMRHCPDRQECLDMSNSDMPDDIRFQIEQAFLGEFRIAEELAEVVNPGIMEMPDAMELIYQSALALGKRGAVEEYMGNIENAVVIYSKAVDLLVCLLVEAPCLILNPPFSLTNTDRYRIRSYIDALNYRYSISMSQKLPLFKSENQPSLSETGDDT
ncbi:serine/threonine-protein kinase ATG1c-like [Primulina huaijiensis]|uniref:serine/threonine-protein kinase ATG1c-like n=1 Tax=Primulina huaijiensis TaxID=1492673 RepID=UPI003CC722A6